MKHIKRPDPIPLTFINRTHTQKPKNEDEEETLMYLEQLRTMSPISFKRKDPIEIEPTRILAVLPHNLGKIQKLTTYKHDLAYILQLDNGQKVKFTDTIPKSIKEKDHPELPIIKEKKRSMSTKFPASSHHYFKKNLGIFSPGIIRVIPKDGRPRTPVSVKKFSHEIIKTPSPKKANLSTISTRINISPLQKRTQETRISQSYVVKHAPSPVSKSTALEKGEELVKDESSHLKIECYKGEYSNGKRHGNGEIVYNNGDSYSGNWVNNKKEGHGRYFYNHTGTVYSGEWVNNKRHGSGKMKFKNGDRIIGTWTDGKLSETHAVIQYGDSGRYKGETRNGVRHGMGTMKYQSKYFYRGLWDTDRREGNGIIVFKRDVFFEGTFRGDSTEGPGVLVRKDAIEPKESSSQPDTPSNIFIQREHDAYDRKSELGQFQAFPEFKQISIEYDTVIYISLTSEQFRERISLPHPNIESGNFRSGKLNGAGLAKYGIFGKYEGSFKEGCRSGWGKMTYTDPEHCVFWFHETEGMYYGEWKDDFKHGSGVMTWPNGMRYEGRYNKDRRHHVTGKMSFQNGEIYEGGWVDDKMEGACKFIQKNGMVFKGQFSRGLPMDSGILEYPDGNRYEGRIEKWLPNGNGKMRWASGDVYEGAFTEGIIDGVGKMIYSNGDMYHGEWETGKRNGKGLMKYAKTGETYEGDWIADSRDGQGILKDAAGEVMFWGMWRADKKEGRGSIAHTPSGMLVLSYL